MNQINELFKYITEKIIITKYQNNELLTSADLEQSWLDQYEIELIELDRDRYMRVLKCSIYDKVNNNFVKWIVGPMGILFGVRWQQFRDDLLVNNEVEGIVVVERAFERYTATAAALFVIGENVEETWLTTVNSPDSLKNVIINPSFSKDIVYAKVLNPKNLSPSSYVDYEEEKFAELEEYETVNLGDVAELFGGKGVSSWNLQDTGIPYLRARDIKDGKIITCEKYVSESDLEKYAKGLLQEGDIIISRSFADNKIAVISIENLPAIASDAFVVIRPYGINEKYLYDYLTSDTYKESLKYQLDNMKHGTIIPSLPISNLKGLQVPLFDQKLIDQVTELDEFESSKAKSVVLNLIKNIKKEEYSEMKIIQNLINNGWTYSDIKREDNLSIQLADGEGENINIRPDISLYQHENLIAIIEFLPEFHQGFKSWVKLMSVVKNSKICPILILSTNNYYEIHNCLTGKIIKREQMPTKLEINNIITGKEIE